MACRVEPVTPMAATRPTAMHRAEIARLRMAGADRCAEALTAAVEGWLEEWPP